MKKKTIALVLAVVMLFGTVVGSTLAYLLDSQKVVNTFTVGKVEIKLDEADVDEYGQPKTDDTGSPLRDSDGNQYKLIPGMTYVKDPTVHIVTNSEEAYVRMIVTITDLEDVKAVFGTDSATGYFLPQYFVDGWDPSVWVTTGVVVEEDNTAKYEFRYHKTVSAGNTDVDLEPLFTSFTVPGSLDNDDIESLNELEIKVEAHAIQAAGFTGVTDDTGETVKTAEEVAWEAFDAQKNTENTQS